MEAGPRHLEQDEHNFTFKTILLTISHHYLGDAGLPGSLDHSVQVTAELLVGEVGPDVDDDVVTELVHHGGGPGDLSQGVKIR